MTNLPVFHSSFRSHDIEAVQPISGKVPASWVTRAEELGYRALGKVRNRMYTALECSVCGTVNIVHREVLMNSRPRCTGCLTARQQAEAETAGLELLHRDGADRHYAFYRASCGHVLRRQISRIAKIAKTEAEVLGVRCEVCLIDTMKAEARIQGWELIGPDPDGDANYRLYRHSSCGHEQRVARVNMCSGRFQCTACGKKWPSAESAIYLLRFFLPGVGEVVKLGFSRDPWSRQQYQLGFSTENDCRIERIVAVPTGHQALIEEKKMHQKLRRSFPQTIVGREALAGQVSVVTEVYRAEISPAIYALLDALEARLSALAPVTERSQPPARTSVRHRRNRSRSRTGRAGETAPLRRRGAAPVSEANLVIQVPGSGRTSRRIS